MAKLPRGPFRLAVVACLVLVLADTASATTVEPLFDAPPLAIADDEILLLSTRNIGTLCQGKSMHRQLSCLRLVRSLLEPKAWKKADWRQLLSTQASMPTIVYVHGNRVASGQDRRQGMDVYRSLKAQGKLNGPVRFIIWSWPSEQISGPIKDYVVKAQRTNPAAWQLAWLLDKLPAETPITLVGYSYGTRVVSGATHLLAGGRLGQLQLAERTHPRRPPLKVALLAAAYDADWIQPGHYYGRSLGQIERLVLATNKLDPAMRFYHLSNGLGRMHALGKSGVHQPRALGTASRRLQRVDLTREVGRSHSLDDYLAAEGKMRIFWGKLLTPKNFAMAHVPSGQSLGSPSQH